MLNTSRSCFHSQLGSWGRNKSFVCVIVGRKSNKRVGDGVLSRMDPLWVLRSPSLNKSENRKYIWCCKLSHKELLILLRGEYQI